MKVMITIVLVQLLGSASFAQQDTLHDFFPLNVGNKWTYGFRSDQYNPGEYINDTGKTEYQIISSFRSADSLYWWFVQRRNFSRRIVRHSGESWQSIVDSSFFGIVENEEGRHTLYLTTNDRENSFFPFYSCFTPHFTRFTSDTSHDVTFARNLVEFNRCNTTTYTTNAILRRDTGLVHLQSHWVWITWSIDMTFDLRDFRSSYVGPHLSYLTRIPITTLVGIPMDTTLSMENNGDSTLLIQGVTCSDPDVAVSFEFNTIPPRGTARLTLHYTSQSAGQTSANVYVTSNSTSSPDTIVLVFTNRVESRTLLSSKDFDFGHYNMVVGYREMPLVISNTGNLDLTFDSIRTSDPDFAAILDTSYIAPLSGRQCLIRFAPDYPSETRKNATLLFFTNSISSPDTIRATGWPVGGKFEFNQRSVDFGEMTIGRKVDTAITMSRHGWVVLGLARQNPSHSAFSGLGATYQICNACDSLVDSLRFTPNLLGHMQGHVVYTSSNGDLRGYDTIWLSGTGVWNDPIPSLTFSATNIDFGTLVVGQYRDSALTVSIMQNGNPVIDRDTTLSNRSFKLAMERNGGAVIHDTIRFEPVSAGIHKGILVYRVMIEDWIAKADTIRFQGEGLVILPTRFSLYQNYPNPFNPGTTIGFDIPIAGFVTLKVFDLLGREVAMLVNEEMQPGSYERVFHAKGLASGVYFYRLQTPTITLTRKMLLMQ